MTVEPQKLPTSNRTWMTIAGVIALIVVAVLIAISATGGSSVDPNDLAGVDDANALFEGVPQSGLVIGRANAPVTIAEYLDMQCPFCADAAKGTVPQLVNKFVKTGQAKLELRPLAFIGDDSVRGAKAVIAAGEQNKAGQFTDILFHNQGGENSGWLSDSMIDAAAEAALIDTGTLSDDRSSGATEKRLNEISAAGQADAVQSTPTFVVIGPNGTRTIQNRQNITEFEQAIAAVR